jgi:hypothetical protein
MGLMDDVRNILGRHDDQARKEEGERRSADFETIAAQAGSSQIAGGLAAAFRSNETPPFPDMLVQMLAQASGPERAGLLNTLIGALDPAAAGQILSRVDGRPSTGASLTPEQAERLPVDVARSLAVEAERQDPSVVDRISHFSAGHPALVKAIGAGALAMVLSHVHHHGQNPS